MTLQKDQKTWFGHETGYKANTRTQTINIEYAHHYNAMHCTSMHRQP